MSTSNPSWTMASVKNILFPTDFSHHADHTMPYVVAFAKNLGAKVHVLHVVDTSFRWEEQPYEAALQRRPGYTTQDEVEARVEEIAQEARDAGVNAERHWRQGDIGDEILRLIDEFDIGLVIMSTHARDKPELNVVGSKYLKTIHDADVPVLAIKHPEHEFVIEPESSLSVKRVLCPCDLGAYSHQAVPIAADICRHFGAELVLVHVAHTYEEYMALEGLGGEPAARVDTFETLAHLTDAYGDVSSRIVAVKGKPEHDLAKVCKTENADLVVMATHGRKPLIRSIVGSVTERLIIDVPCPIMTIRPDLLAQRFAS